MSRRLYGRRPELIGWGATYSVKTDSLRLDAHPDASNAPAIIAVIKINRTTPVVLVLFVSNAFMPFLGISKRYPDRDYPLIS